MYNGIGLQTPRGSGTNGYVQRNMSFVPKSREKVNYRTEEDIKKLDALANKKPNEAILAHERKRLVELKCFEMQELMEEQGCPEDEIESKVAVFRKMIMEKNDYGDEREVPKDTFGRPIVKESHQMAEANQEKNLKMREALGISQYFVEGSSLDPTRKAKEAAAAEEAKKKYAIIPDSSSSSPERTQEKEKVKKRKKKKSLGTHEKLESISSTKKKKSSKKHKKDRSVSPEHHKKKKSKKAAKDKAKYKSKKTRNCSSSSSSVASSSSADDESSSRSSSISSLSEQSDGSSYKRHKHSSKTDRNHKKRNSSPEGALYTKESRSRKDLYEAKKGKRKRKSARSPSSSTSEEDSSPKQYYRLEPVLLKSKMKHKKTRQFIEVPKKKKRVYESSSSSSSVIKSKSESKRRRHSSSPEALKYHFSRNELNPTLHKGADTSRCSKRHPKSSCSPDEKMRYEQSCSPDSLHKSKHKKNIPQVGSSSRRSKNKTSSSYDDKHPKEPKSSDRHLYKRTSMSPEKSHTKRKYESQKSWHKRKESKSPRRLPSKKKGRDESSPKHHKHNKEAEHRYRNSESPKHRRHKDSNTLVRHRYKGLGSPAQNSESPDCHNGSYDRARSPSVESGYSPGGPGSFSPFNEEKYLTRSPSFPPKYKHKKHILNESPPYSSQTVKKNKISPKISQKSTSRTVTSSRSISKSASPDGYYLGKSKQRHSSSPQICSSKKVSQKRTSPEPISKKRKMSKSKSSSPELEVKRRCCGDRSHSSSASNSTQDMTRNPLQWKSNAEVKDISLQLKNLCGSPKGCSFKSRNSPQKVNTEGKERAEIPERKSPKTFESSPPINNSLITDVFQAIPDSKLINMKRRHDPQDLEDSPHKITKPSPSRNKNSNSDNEKIFFNLKSISIPQPPDDKAEEHKIVESSNSSIVNSKGKFCFGSFGSSQNLNVENVNSSLKANHHSQKDQIKSKSRNEEKNRSETPESTASCSHNLVSQNLDFEKSKEVHHSRSRSTSAAQSCSASGSDRSSRSRSRSYSKSHSKSYSKSPSVSRSKSRSKSFSRSHSKSYSRSRSRSASVYSRSRSRSYSSRSRSRSIARSPSIPRRRGSPSFLDKRRITS